MRILPSSLLPQLALLLATAACGFSQAPPPDAPQSQTAQPGKPLTARPPRTESQTEAQAAEALRISKLPIVNGVKYDQPSTKDTLIDYARDTYGWPALARTSIRAVYAQLHATYVDTPSSTSWGTDFPGFMQRFGSAAGITAINGNVRLGMELLFHEDLRYLPCHGCKPKAKLENALLSEITARHEESGRRFFTLTPTIADFSGPIIAHSTWYPEFNPMDGVVSARFVFATRIGQHLFQEFVMERRHHDPPYEKEPGPPKPGPAPAVSPTP